MNKYRNKKVEIDGIRFDSKRESERYCELLILQKAGEIKELVLQPKFELQGHFKHEGKMVRSIVYIADFACTETLNGVRIVEDVKGIETKDFIIKKKLFLKKFGELYKFQIVK